MWITKTLLTIVFFVIFTFSWPLGVYAETVIYDTTTTNTLCEAGTNLYANPYFKYDKIEINSSYVNEYQITKVEYYYVNSNASSYIVDNCFMNYASGCSSCLSDVATTSWTGVGSSRKLATVVFNNPYQISTTTLWWGYRKNSNYTQTLSAGTVNANCPYSPSGIFSGLTCNQAVSGSNYEMKIYAEQIPDPPQSEEEEEIIQLLEENLLDKDINFFLDDILVIGVIGLGIGALSKL